MFYQNEKKTIACTFYNDFNSPLDLASGVKKEKHGNYSFAPKYELKVCSFNSQKKEWGWEVKNKTRKNSQT